MAGIKKDGRDFLMGRFRFLFLNILAIRSNPGHPGSKIKKGHCGPR